MKTHERRRRSSLMPSYWRNPVDRFLGNDFLGMWNEDGAVTVPAVNIKEQENNFMVELAAPGLKKEDFNIDVDGNTLTISSEQESEKSEGGDSETFSRREYNYSSFSRSLTLPENADAEQISAKYNEGVLQLNIPKKKTNGSDKAKKIKVE